MKIALITDSPYVTTGFGIAARNLNQYLNDSGLNVTQLGIYQFDRDMTDFHGTHILPVSPEDSMGLERLTDLLASDPDIFLIMHEIMYTGIWTGALRSLGFQQGIIGFVPVYGPCLTRRELITLRLLDFPITFSEYGSHILHDHNIDCSWIHLGVDHALFNPASEEQIAKKKRLLGWDSAFTFAYIARNRWNKQQPKLIKAARLLLDMGIDDFRIYIHCVPHAVSPHWIPGMGMLNQEWDLVSLRNKLDVTQHVLFPDDLENQHNGIREIELVDRLRAADCVVHVAHGEGFGLPLVESLACAVPVACTADGRVMQEVVGDAGILVDTDNTLEDTNGNRYKDVRPEEWAHAMADIYRDFQDIKYRQIQRKKAYSRSLAFDWEMTARKLVSCINGLGVVESTAWHHG